MTARSESLRKERERHQGRIRQIDKSLCVLASKRLKCAPVEVVLHGATSDGFAFRTPGGHVKFLSHKDLQ